MSTDIQSSTYFCIQEVPKNVGDCVSVVLTFQCM